MHHSLLHQIKGVSERRITPTLWTGEKYLKLNKIQKAVPLVALENR